MASNTDQETTKQPTSAFSWDSLPEVAKERWEEMVAYSSTVENQLSKAKSSRAQAEQDRQRLAGEALTATKEACRAVVADARQTLAKIKRQTEEAEKNHAESERRLAEAKVLQAEAEAYRENMIARTEQQAHEILQKATHASEIECARLKKQVSLESYQLLVQAETMRAAAQEELEAQKIYSEAAMLKADATEVLNQLQAHLQTSLESMESLEAEAAGEAGQQDPTSDTGNGWAESSQVPGDGESHDAEAATGQEGAGSPKSAETPAAAAGTEGRASKVRQPKAA